MTHIIMVFVLYFFFLSVPAQATSTADPSATPQTKALYNYLVGLARQPSHKMITGQMIWLDMVTRGPIDYSVIEDVRSKTGQTPGLIGMLEPCCPEDPTATQFTIDYWNQGGLIMSHILIGNRPEYWYGLPLSEAQITSVMTDQRYIDWLNWLVRAYLHYQEQGVVLLARPFLEMNGPWNWYYTSNYELYKTLWIQLFEYMTSHGVHNLLYIYCPDSGFGTYMERYPGDQYVDIVCLDSYFDLDGQPYQSGGKIDGYDVLVATGKPLVIGEYGPFSTEPPITYQTKDAALLLQGLKENMPEIVWVMHWSSPYNLGRMANIAIYMNDPYVQNRPVPFNRTPAP